MEKLTSEQQELLLQNRGLSYSFYRTKVTHAAKKRIGEEVIIDAFTDTLIACVQSFDESKGAKFSSYVYKAFGNKMSTMAKQLTQTRLKETRVVKPKQDKDNMVSLGSGVNHIKTEPRIDRERLLECIDNVGLTPTDKKILLTKYLYYGGDGSSPEILSELKMTKQNIHKRSTLAALKVNAYMQKNGIKYEDFIIK